MIDSLGEECGQELFFHGEVIDSIEDFEALHSASKLFAVLTDSWDVALATYNKYRFHLPLLLATPDRVGFFASGASFSQLVETAPLNYFFL